jgi:tetratricopeptide (TPR) repeat protein
LLSSSGDALQWRQKFVKLLAQEFPTGNFENWAKCQRLLPHIESLYDAEPTSDDYLKDWAQLLTHVGWYMWMMGKYEAAEKVARIAVTARERVLRKDNRMTLISIIFLAGVPRYQGKYSEAEKLARRALEGREKELGEQHPYTLTSVRNLAGVLGYQGKLHRRTLEGKEKELREQHPDSPTSVSNLALVLRDQGKYSEAEKLNRRALKGYEREQPGFGTTRSGEIFGSGEAKPASAGREGEGAGRATRTNQSATVPGSQLCSRMYSIPTCYTSECSA